MHYLKSFFQKLGWLEKTAIAAVLFIILILIFSGIFYRPQQQSTTSAKDADLKVAALEEKVEQQSDDVALVLSLARAYLQRVRETADTDYYTKIDALMKDIEEKASDKSQLYAVQAQVAAGRHNFAEALKLAKQAEALDGDNSQLHGLIGDAQIELGQYDDALVSYEKMIELRPDFGSYSRVAYARELYGDIEGAIEAMEMAIEASAPFPENFAWAYVELGRLNFGLNPQEAGRNFGTALDILPDYAPAYRWKGRLAYAEGDLNEAFEHMNKAKELLPIDTHLIDLAELHMKKGEKEKAQQLFTLVKVVYEKAEKNGVDVDLESALFLADHDLNFDEALEKARRGYEKRQSVYAADVYAWVLYKNQQYQEAEKYMEEAMKLGSRDSTVLFHAGMIAKSVNKNETAKEYLSDALRLNKHFSILYDTVAEEALQGL